MNIDREYQTPDIQTQTQTEAGTSEGLILRFASSPRMISRSAVSKAVRRWTGRGVQNVGPCRVSRRVSVAEHEVVKASRRKKFTVYIC